MQTTYSLHSTSAVHTLQVRATYPLHSTSAVYPLPVRATYPLHSTSAVNTLQVRATYKLHSTSAVHTLPVRATYSLHSTSAVHTLPVRATYFLHSRSAVHTLPVRATYTLHSTSAVPTLVGRGRSAKSEDGQQSRLERLKMSLGLVPFIAANTDKTVYLFAYILWKQRELIQHSIRRIATIASVKQGAALTVSVSLNAGGLRSNRARTVGASSFTTGSTHSSLIAPLRTLAAPYRSFVAWTKKEKSTNVSCAEQQRTYALSTTQLQPNPNQALFRPAVE